VEIVTILMYWVVAAGADRKKTPVVVEIGNLKGKVDGW